MIQVGRSFSRSRYSPQAEQGEDLSFKVVLVMSEK
jgi:hypothetical protein